MTDLLVRRTERRVSSAGRITLFVEDAPHAVYRIRDARRLLVYIGMSHDPEQRIRTHRATVAWRVEIVTVEEEWHPSRYAAGRAEIAAIDAERPYCGVPTWLAREISDISAGRLAAHLPKRQAIVEARERYRLDAIAWQLAR